MAPPSRNRAAVHRRPVSTDHWKCGSMLQVRQARGYAGEARSYDQGQAGCGVAGGQKGARHVGKGVVAHYRATQPRRAEHMKRQGLQQDGACSGLKSGYLYAGTVVIGHTGLHRHQADGAAVGWAGQAQRTGAVDRHVRRAHPKVSQPPGSPPGPCDHTTGLPGCTQDAIRHIRRASRAALPLCRPPRAMRGEVVGLQHQQVQTLACCGSCAVQSNTGVLMHQYATA